MRKPAVVVSLARVISRSAPYPDIMLYSIFLLSDDASIAPHLVATIHGRDLSAHMLDQLETEHPDLTFEVRKYQPQEVLIHWHDSSFAM